MVDSLLPDGSSDIRAAEERGGKVFIGNIMKGVEKDDVYDYFSQYGKLLSIWIAKNPPGFCFVTYDEPEDAKTAVAKANGDSDASFVESNGRGLRVEASTSAGKKNKGRGRSRRGDSRPRRDRGGGGRRGDSRGRRGRSDRRDSRGRGGGRGRDNSRGRGHDRRDERRDERDRRDRRH